MGYSIAIRTLGKAGEKYQVLLDSIQRSNLKPEKVFVVLPYGYGEPKEKLGWEKFIYCEKSMIQQRIEALKYITSEYTLFLDDDIAFDEEWVQKLMEPLEEKKFDCSTGPLFSFFPNSLAGRIAGTLTASVSISIFNRDKYVKILRSGGWSYHKFDTGIKRYYPTESFAWTCFMIRTDVMRNICMEDEKKWLEKYGYAVGDDRVMAYKLIKKGYRACVVSNALYQHNDAKTSTAPDEMNRTKPVFCMYYMHVIFWHRFVQDATEDKWMKVYNKIWFCYWENMMKLYHLIKRIRPTYAPYRDAFYAGIKAGKKYVKSEEYKQLNSIL